MKLKCYILRELYSPWWNGFFYCTIFPFYEKDIACESCKANKQIIKKKITLLKWLKLLKNKLNYPLWLLVFHLCWEKYLLSREIWLYLYIQFSLMKQMLLASQNVLFTLLNLMNSFFLWDYKITKHNQLG